MTYRLRREYNFTHAKTGKPQKKVSYFSYMMADLFPTGSCRTQDARIFPTKALAEIYARNKLRGRGYKPERIPN